MDQAKLQAILTAHSLWLSTNGREGTRAHLREADLSEANRAGGHPRRGPAPIQALR
jgi:hypothetical protein